MSIATEISRLQTAKADIKTAIEAKGVTVPSNATLDDYDTYVSQISGGGGGTNYLADYTGGTLTGAITSTQLGTHIGNKMPKYFLFEQSNITSVDLTGTGATKIADYFCGDCTNLTSITIPSSVTSIESDFLNKCSAVTSVNIPNSVTTIGGNLLIKCSAVTSVNIPSSVTSMGTYAMNGCTSLTQLIFNSSTAPRYLCNACPQLALIDLNSSVSEIGRGSFKLDAASTSLLEVVLRNTNSVVTLPAAFGSTSSTAAFVYRQNVKIYVPSALIASYQANTYWAAGITAGYLTIVALEGSQYE